MRFPVVPPSGSSPLARGTRSKSEAGAFSKRFIPARAGNTPDRGRAPRPAAVHPRSRGEHAHVHQQVSVAAGSSPLARGTPSIGLLHRSPSRFIPARAGNTRDRTFEPVPVTVHPRSRGEHWRRRAHGAGLAGSSPLARGTPRYSDLDHAVLRFIPARAGNTTSRRRASTPPAVHPRSRGEHIGWETQFCRTAGSSPLARGTHRVGDAVLPHRRFIPARAGNTGCSTMRTPAPPVHPRSRGEHQEPGFDPRCRRGSSPLARGTPVHRPGRGPRGRFIPARAGNTRWVRKSDASVTVHPRSRGEHGARTDNPDVPIGSSPLARGTLSCPGDRFEHQRFIPARAGNTRGSTTCAPPAPVHPRSRGEHSRNACVVRAVSGSSPLARGTRFLILAFGFGVRFIPARAGNTCRPGAGRRPPPVHPRSRGEHMSPRSWPPATSGSSPLARGTRSTHRITSAHCRFIPARAGNT